MISKKIAIIAAASAAAMIALLVLAAVVFTALGFEIYRIEGESMHPSIENGECILVRDVDPSTLEKGDVITFYSSEKAIFGMPNTHRIVSEPIVNNDGSYSFVTAGDNADSTDNGLLSEDKIIGKMICKLPLVSRICEIFG